MANLPILKSIDVIRKQYPTGEEPVLVMCSDMNFYMCKYIRHSASNQKLACELIGSKMAMVWKLNVPKISLVKIKSEHWPSFFVRPKTMTTMLGSRYLDAVEYVLPSTFDKLAKTSEMFNQLLKIALFDLWMANEDRNSNNSNLLYDISNKSLVPIDFGCILNTADFQSPLMQLTATDTIINSPLFKYLSNGISSQGIQKVKDDLQKSYAIFLNQCRSQIDAISKEIPSDWGISAKDVTNKLLQLFEPAWTERVWDNFEEYLNDNLLEKWKN